MRNLDFSDWHSLLQTVLGLALFTLIGMGIRVLAMFTVQARRERMNRQINERLKVLIAAYKTLGGSFTGDLAVDPTHMRDLRARADPGSLGEPASDRARRIRDAVEGALSDVLLLGTEQQVRLAQQAARDMVAGRPVHMDQLVVSLRDFIRDALDLAPLPAGLAIPPQGPTRPSSASAKARSGGDAGAGSDKGGGMGGGGMGGAGMGGGMGFGPMMADHPGHPDTP